MLSRFSREFRNRKISGNGENGSPRMDTLVLTFYCLQFLSVFFSCSLLTRSLEPVIKQIMMAVVMLMLMLTPMIVDA